MGQEITPLCSIDPMMDEINVVVRCISIWFNHPPGKPEAKWGMEMVLQDQQGNRVQASIKKDSLAKFQPILQEKTCYKISNFGVGDNGGKYPLLTHKYRINFFKNTSVTRVNNFDKNVYGFKFEPFQNFATKHFKPTDVVDVIGSVVSISDLIPFSGGLDKEKKRRTILLEDTDGLQIECCFFDSWADRFNILAEQRERVGHVALILQNARVKYFNDKPSIGNAVVSTKIYNSSNVPEIAAFKKRFQANPGYDEKKHAISLWSPPKKEITPEIFFSGAVKIMVGNIRSSYSKQDCLSYAKIHKIHREYGWWFTACKQCGRSAKENDDEGSSKQLGKYKKKIKTWNCRVHKAITFVVPKYKVIIRVTDESGDASLLLYEDMIMQLINIPGYKMIEQFKDSNIFPDDLKAIVGKEFLFRYVYSDWNIENNNHIYQVKYMTQDAEMIETFKKDFNSEDNDSEFETPLNHDVSDSKFGYQDSIPFNIDATPESGKVVNSSYGESIIEDLAIADATSEEHSANKEISEDQSADKAIGEEKSSDKAISEENSADKASIEENSADKASIEENSADKASSEETSADKAIMNEKDKRVFIDLENYDEYASDAKKAKKTMVQVKVEKDDE